MQSFPMFIKTTDRHFVVVGDGEQAAQKSRLLMKSDVHIKLLSNDPDDELQAFIKKGRMSQVAGPITPASFEGATLGFIATGSPAADVCIHDIAKQAGVLVNVVDRPALCDITTPSIVDRDPVVVAIGTEGTAPVLARRIKTRVEQMLDPNLGRFAQAAGDLRDMVARYVPQDQRRAFWREIFTGSIWQKFKSGSERQALSDFKTAIRDGANMTSQGAITVIDTSAGAADLISLRAVERLQEADEIFFEDQTDEDILELARRDAERSLLGSAGRAQPWPAHMCISFVKRAAQGGRNVVWLKNCMDTDLDALQADLTGSEDLSIEWLVQGQTKAKDALKSARS